MGFKTAPIKEREESYRLKAFGIGKKNSEAVLC